MITNIYYIENCPIENDTLKTVLLKMIENCPIETKFRIVD